MVPADSDRIPRAPPYSGVTLRRISLPVPGCHRLRRSFPEASGSDLRLTRVILQPRRVRERDGLGSSLFDRHYWGNRLFFLLLRVLRCFSSPGSPRIYVRSTAFSRGGCPIRIHPDQVLFADPRTFSQLTASFFACRSQGILHAPLLLFLCESFLIFCLREIVSYLNLLS